MFILKIALIFYTLLSINVVFIYPFYMLVHPCLCSTYWSKEVICRKHLRRSKVNHLSLRCKATGLSSGCCSKSFLSFPLCGFPPWHTPWKQGLLIRAEGFRNLLIIYMSSNWSLGQSRVTSWMKERHLSGPLLWWVWADTFQPSCSRRHCSESTAIYRKTVFLPRF